MIRWITWCLDHDRPIPTGSGSCGDFNYCTNKARAVVIVDEENA